MDTRDVCAVVLVLALAVAFDAIVVGAIVHGVIPESLADAIGASFVLLVILLAAVLGISLKGGNP